MDAHQDELIALARDDAEQTAISRALQGPPRFTTLWRNGRIVEALIHLSGRVDELCVREATTEEKNAPSIFDQFAL